MRSRPPALRFALRELKRRAAPSTRRVEPVTIALASTGALDWRLEQHRARGRGFEPPHREQNTVSKVNILQRQQQRGSREVLRGIARRKVKLVASEAGVVAVGVRGAPRRPATYPEGLARRGPCCGARAGVAVVPSITASGPSASVIRGVEAELAEPKAAVVVASPPC